jgi:predicted ATPase/class 3 adenylate cyclase
MPELPSGTVTFLFTDIEGSTALWEREQQAMAAAVNRYFALLRVAIAAQGGVLFKTVGDGVQAAFPSAPDAVAAAIAAQTTLQAEQWPDPPGPLHVRMALHAGEATPDARGDYLAAPLNRLARLLEVARGGQILLTEAVERLVQDALPPNASLRDLGEVHLRDLERPERVVILMHPDLLSDAALPTSWTQQTRHFPSSRTPFLGRESEVTAVAALLQAPRARLLTLTGPGGTGKTRLALEAGMRVAYDFADGAVFIDLAPLRDPALVLSEVATTLGLREATGRVLRDVVHDFLREREMLLIVDNFEHLLAAAPVISDLLAACPRVTALVTSRASLRVGGEQEYPVPTLRLPTKEDTRDLMVLARNEAIAVFVDRAQAVRPDFGLTPENAPVIAAICARLDGLPLALELAAARVKILPPHALLARLDARLPLLTGGARDAPQRQQTLRDAIAWSYDLLDGAEQTLFQELSVFPARFTLEAAEWLAGTGRGVEPSSGRGDVDTSRRRQVGTWSDAQALPLSPHHPITPAASTLDLLDSLVAKSLVRYEGDLGIEPSYAMLETIREFGSERLAASGRDVPVRQRHADWALALAERAGPQVMEPDAAVWLAVLEREHASLRAAMTWLAEQQDGERLARMAGALWPFWEEHAHYPEGRHWLEVALDLGHAAPAGDRLRLLTGAGTMAWRQTDFAQAIFHHEQALTLAREMGDREAEAFALNNLGAQAMELGHFDDARTRYQATIAIAREAGTVHLVILALHNLGEIQRMQHDSAAALQSKEEALALARQHAMSWGLPSILTGLGLIATDLGDYDRAIALFHESLALAVSKGNLGTIIDGIESLARLAAVTGQAQQSVRLFGAGEALREELDFPLGPNDRAYREPIMPSLREALGEEGFATAWADGRLLAQEEAIADALTVRAMRPPSRPLVPDLT